MTVIKGFFDTENTSNRFVEEFKKAAGLKKVNVDVKDASSVHPIGSGRKFIQYEH